MRSTLKLSLSALVVAAALAVLSAAGASAQTPAPVEANCTTINPLGYYIQFGQPSIQFGQASCQVIEQGAPISAPATVFVVSASPFGAGPSECDGVTAPDYTTQEYSGPLPPLPPQLDAYLSGPGGCVFSVTFGTVFPGEPLGAELFSAGSVPPAGTTELNAVVCDDPSCGTYDTAVYGPPPLPPYPIYQTYEPPAPPVVISYPYVSTTYVSTGSYCTDRDQDCDTDPSAWWRHDHRWRGDDPSGDHDHHGSGDTDHHGSGDADHHGSGGTGDHSSASNDPTTWTWTASQPSVASNTNTTWTSGQPSVVSNTSTTWTSSQGSGGTSANTTSTGSQPTGSANVSATSTVSQPTGSANVSATWTSNQHGSGDTDHHSSANATSTNTVQANTTPQPSGQGSSGSSGEPGHSGHHGH